MKLNHVALTVADRGKAAAFYSRYFGLENRMHDDEHLLILSNENGDLFALSQGEPEPDWKRTTHFGFMMDGADEVRQLRDRFKVDGIIEAEWQERGPTRLQVLIPTVIAWKSMRSRIARQRS